MRFVGTLALLGAAAISLALADPSTTAPASPEKPADTQAAPAAAAAGTTPAAATPAKPALDPEEKRLLAQGYKPEIRNGVKVYCKLEEELGTRLGRIKHCGTPAQLKAQQTDNRETLQKMQRDTAPVVK